MPTPFAPRRFTLFCLASFLLSIAYGVTFLLALRVTALGGTAVDAAQIFAFAMVSTLVAVPGAGLLLPRLGAARSVALAGGLLALASLGFAVQQQLGWPLLACGVLLGLGWGMFYTVGPIMVAASVPEARRTHCFALLSGSMMSGIGSGPLLGAAAAAVGVGVQAAFAVAAVAAAAGTLYFWYQGSQDSAGPARVAPMGLAATRAVMRSRAVLAIIMVGLGGAVFGGLGSFQSTYAASHGLDYSWFFISFTAAAITCRLLLAGWVVAREPYAASAVLVSLMLLAVLSLAHGVTGTASYVAAAGLLGVGYGLNYSVINGLAASEAPVGLIAQSLLLFSLAYFIGVFGFPFIAGRLIGTLGVEGLLRGVEALALVAWLLSMGRVVGRYAARMLAVR